MDKQKKELKEFESEMNINSEFFGLFRDELLNIADKSTKKKKDKSSTQYSKKSRIETTTIIDRSLLKSDTESDSTSKSDMKITIKQTNTDFEKKNNINKEDKENKVDKTDKTGKTVDSFLNNQVDDLEEKEYSEPTVRDNIEFSEYEIIKLKEMIKYFVDINK